MNKIFRIIPVLLLSGCATTVPTKQVTLSTGSGDIRIGQLVYDGPYSGALTFPGDEFHESFTGRFTVVDRTAIKKSSSDIVVPSNNPVPAMGSSATTETKGIDATGYWYGQGSKGTTIKCTLEMGIQGHGFGSCSGSNGLTYEIAL